MKVIAVEHNIEFKPFDLTITFHNEVEAHALAAILERKATRTGISSMQVGIIDMIYTTIVSQLDKT